MKFRKCLNCGANLKINKKLEIKYCEYCGEEYLFEEFLNIEKSNINFNNKNPELVKQKRDGLEGGYHKGYISDKEYEKGHKKLEEISMNLLTKPKKPAITIRDYYRQIRFPECWDKYI